VSGLKGTSHSFPQSAQTALCISFSAILRFQLLCLFCAKIASCTTHLPHGLETYKTCHQKWQAKAFGVILTLTHSLGDSLQNALAATREPAENSPPPESPHLRRAFKYNLTFLGFFQTVQQMVYQRIEKLAQPFVHCSVNVKPHEKALIQGIEQPFPYQRTIQRMRKKDIQTTDCSSKMANFSYNKLTLSTRNISLAESVREPVQ